MCHNCTGEGVASATPDGNGVKYDQGKPDWSLVHLKTMEEFVKVLTFGAEKYTRDGWKTVDHKRVVAALLRHLAKRQDGQFLDEESGILEMAHVMCNCYFLLYWDLNGKEMPDEGTD